MRISQVRLHNAGILLPGRYSVKLDATRTHSAAKSQLTLSTDELQIQVLKGWATFMPHGARACLRGMKVRTERSEPFSEPCAFRSRIR